VHIDKLAVIGVGLIGTSCALALRAASAVSHVVGVGRSQANLDRAEARGAIDTGVLCSGPWAQEVAVADAKIPKKYWWVVAVAVPIVIALIAIVPQLRKPTGGSGGGTTITGGTNTIVYGTNNTFITNVNVFAREYELQTGQPLSDDLRKQIEAAVAAAQQNNHAESVRLFEQVAKAAPIPAIYNNLGVEYAQTKNVDASTRAFQLSKEKLAELTSAGTSSTLPDSAVKPPPVSGPGIRTEASAIPAMTIDPISPPYEAPDEINVVDHGTSLRGAYRVKYQPKPGVTVAMEPGAYDVVLTVGSGAGFIVASGTS